MSDSNMRGCVALRNRRSKCGETVNSSDHCQRISPREPPDCQRDTQSSANVHMIFNNLLSNNKYHIWVFDSAGACSGFTCLDLHLCIWAPSDIALRRFCLCPADLQRGLPDPRQCRHRHGVSVRSEDQPEHHRCQRGGPQRDLQNSEGQRGHVHPEVGQRRR